MPLFPMTPPVAPALASTLLLVRDRDGLEVLMVERHGEMLFGPGALVFPGGKLDAQDGDPAWANHVAGCAEVGSQERCLRLCAIRETFEETGMLLGWPISGGSGPGDLARQALRSGVLAGDPTFRQAVAGLGWRFDLDALTPFARWITPQNQPIRFDASFYIARAPEGQAAVCDGRETVSAEWLAPAAALRLADDGLRKLMRPTRANLALLAESSNVAQALAAAKARAVETVLQPD